jgi:hypothetical protein
MSGRSAPAETKRSMSRESQALFAVKEKNTHHKERAASSGSLAHLENVCQAEGNYTLACLILEPLIKGDQQHA